MVARVRLGTLGEERVWQPAPRSGVVIMGMGLTTQIYLQQQYSGSLPDNLRTAEVWAVNSAAKVFRHDLAFDLHDLDTYVIDYPDYVKDVEWYRDTHAKYGAPLVSVKAYDYIPHSLEFPLAELIEEFKDVYLMNSIAYMIAAALMCGVKDLGLFGCDFNYPNMHHYEVGRCCVEYWLGRARERGVNVWIPEESMLLDNAQRVRTGVYGYGSVQPIFDCPDGTYDSVRLDRFVDMRSLEMPEVNPVLELVDDDDQRAA